MNNPEFAEINNKKYKINTDFRIAIKCDEIAKNEKIGDLERALAIIYLLYGDDGLKAHEDYLELIEIAKKYLSCNQEATDEEPDMDFVEDMDYIETSFYSDYKISLENVKMHWWKFYRLIEGLSNSELGNCCILNRIREIRNIDLSKISDDKERARLKKAKEHYALKKDKVGLTPQQQQSLDAFNKSIGL